jgi:hypothetical protein
MSNYNLFVWLAALLILVSGLAHKPKSPKAEMSKNVTVVAKTRY